MGVFDRLSSAKKQPSQSSSAASTSTADHARRTYEEEISFAQSIPTRTLSWKNYVPDQKSAVLDTRAVDCVRWSNETVGVTKTHG